MSPIEHEIEQWEGRKGSRCGIRPFGQRRIKENLKKKKKHYSSWDKGETCEKCSFFSLKLLGP